MFTLFTKQSLKVGSNGKLATAKAGTPFALKLTTGCPDWPEVDVNVTGDPFGGSTTHQEVRGYVDGHTHGMAFEFLGGDVHCGRPWHPYGVAAALKDCPDHELANGAGAVLENVTRTGSPVGTHDPVGWPTFKDWPASDSLTHEGTYWKWLERSWRGGQRILVNLLVENNKLCELYPLKRNSCNDMKSVRLQADDMRKLERYIDAQYGGPGRGWYRIVTNPFEAREVINAGKMAVVMGIETSVVFGCTMKLDKPACTTGQIDRQINEVHDMGVRQMELVNKFDNALAGVAGDSGTIAPFVNLANLLETASFWDMQKCPDPQEPGVEDRTQLTSVPRRYACAGRAVRRDRQAAPRRSAADLPGPADLQPAWPDVARRPHDRAVGRQEDDLRSRPHERQGPQVVPGPASSSSTTRASSPATPGRRRTPTRASTRRVASSRPTRATAPASSRSGRQHLTWADPRYYFGFGYGADINGLGAQGSARGANAPNKVTYPFDGLGGVSIDKQVSGERTYDINVDGVAHYGLYPDWIEDLRKQGGDNIADDMARGSEAYLQMWERAEGITNDACRDPDAAKLDTEVLGIAMRLDRRAGAPHRRPAALPARRRVRLLHQDRGRRGEDRDRDVRCLREVESVS